MKPSFPAHRTAYRKGTSSEGERIIPEEVGVALSYDGGTYAVMMATPSGLDDFGLGFSLTEGIVTAPDQIKSFAVVETGDGIELQMWLEEPLGQALSTRRRRIAGPTGCGLCGIDSLADAMRPPRAVISGLRVSAKDVHAALASLSPAQSLNRETRAVHAAGFWRQDFPVIVREDVGRHNALDKLVGALAREGIAGSAGILVLTSRVSVEMVQKAAVLGTSVIVAVSAPTALAVRMAEKAGITLIAIAREDGFEVFSHGETLRAG